MSEELDKLIKERRNNNKKKKNQIPYAIVLIVLLIILAYKLLNLDYNYAVSLIIGTAIGLVLRYSRFCFVGAVRDPFTGGNTKLLRGVLMAMIVSTIGFFVIQNNYLKTHPIRYEFIPGTVSPVGLHIMIGAFMFGIGMVIAGGCASGVLMRMGEGHLLQWIILLGFLIGTVLGAKDYPFWYKHIIAQANTVYFPEYINFNIVVVLQLIVLIILYILALKYEKRKK
ncbi:YeeE/YedE thiosulfate transporter family protein [Clostridium rectalis]|uniref:YeeE/YedE thiosulfate transporter family protein n=1 Tax=Clostridium rectalis TaxID=2040295 RepID=UPI000F640588|nr:YeeE/YedE thiosulfate transporter family protein [Clostridium rectalis]